VGGSFGDADFVALGVDFAVNVDISLAPLAKAVHDRDAYAVQAARNFIRLFIEFAAGMEARHYKLQGAHVFLRVNVHGNAAAVVLDTDNIVAFQNYQYIGTKALHGFVYGVVNDLKNEVVKTVYARGPDIHAGTGADGLKTLQNCDIFCGIAVFCTHFTIIQIFL
jgi:hypothetical protein